MRRSLFIIACMEVAKRAKLQKQTRCTRKLVSKLQCSDVHRTLWTRIALVYVKFSGSMASQGCMEARLSNA